MRSVNEGRIRITAGTWLGWTVGVGDGEFATPPDHDSDLDECAGSVGADEHDHVVVLTDVLDRESQRVEHLVSGDAVAVGRGQDDRFVRFIVHCRKITCRKVTCQPTSGVRSTSPSSRYAVR
jgi:hypothetical protein